MGQFTLEHVSRNKIHSAAFIYIPSSMAAGLEVNFCTPAAASRSHVVITACETRASRSSKMNLHGQQELLASGRESSVAML